MSYPLLQLLRHNLAKSAISQQDRQMLWAAFCLAFFGSLRFGEILSNSSSSFLPKETLLWRDTSLLSPSHLLLKLKNTKTAAFETVDIFSIPSLPECPVAAFSRFKISSIFLPDTPVFTWKSGTFLTLKEVNSWIVQLLQPQLGPLSSQLSAHSFRAAIPTLLARFPESASSEEIMGWGRWKSSAYLSYTRLKPDQRQRIYNNIVSLISRHS